MIFVLNRNELKNFLKKNNKNFFLLNLSNDECINKNITILQKKSLDKEMMIKKYNNFIGDLNYKNNSFLWWAELISSKNLFISSLYINIYKFLQFTISIKKNQDTIVLVDDEYLMKQIKYYCKNNKIKCKSKRKNLNYIKIIKNNIKFLIDRWIKKIIINKQLKKLIQGKIDGKNSYNIIRTWIDKRSFDNKNNFHTVYLGKLNLYLKNKNILILAGIISNFNQNINNIKKYNNSNDSIIIPQDYFLKYIDYIKVIFLQFKSIEHFKNIKFNGEDISHLINGEILEARYTGKARDNLLYYYIAKNLSRQLNCNTFIYTFENQGWEKFTILGLKKYSKSFTIGYQHSTIFPRLLNLFPSKNESNIIPLPNKIITIGNKTKELLEKYGNYPKNIINSGCALRYEYLFRKDLKHKSNHKKILVLLSVDVLETTNLLKFIFKSFKDQSFKITLKEHPLNPLKNILYHEHLNIPLNFKLSNKTIDYLLNDADIVIYCGTSVCIEALMIGIPVIYLDINEYYNCDPLFECSYLKWIAKKEDDIIRIINHIYDMDITEFNKLQILAQEYVKNYFLPVTKDKIGEFINEK